MEEMTRKQPDVDRVTKTYKRKATEPPHGPFIEKSRSNSMSALDRQLSVKRAMTGGNEMHRKLINFDYQLTRHPALTAARKVVETCQEGKIQVAFAKTPVLGCAAPGEARAVTALLLLQLLCDEVLGSFFMLFLEARACCEFPSAKGAPGGGVGCRAIRHPILLPGDTVSLRRAGSEAVGGFLFEK